MNPGVVRKVFNMPVGLEDGVRLPPQNGHANFRDLRVAGLQVLHHLGNRLPGINHVVDEEHVAVEFAQARDAVGNVERALHGARSFTVRTRRKDGERHVVDAAEEVPGAHPAAREAEETIEVPAALGDFRNESFVQVDVLGPGIIMFGHGSAANAAGNVDE